MGNTWLLAIGLEEVRAESFLSFSAMKSNFAAEVYKTLFDGFFFRSASRLSCLDNAEVRMS